MSSFHKMKAICIQKSPDDAKPYSVENPAPSSALYLNNDVEVPRPDHPDELLVRIHAATITRDELTWPETYPSESHIPGYEFAGTVASVYANDKPDGATEGHNFKPGDEVYGMRATDGNGATWAEYAIIRADEAALKPTTLDWAESATVPMSVLTAWQALFVKAGIPEPKLPVSIGMNGGDRAPKRSPSVQVLITGASGAVGTYLVQLGSLAGLHVVAASTSRARNEEFLKSLGADEVVEYDELTARQRGFDVIIDTVGGQVLETCWRIVTDQGALITIDSASFDFVERHRELPLSGGKEGVNAQFFILKHSGEQLRTIATAVDLKLLRVFVAQTFPLSQAREAYEFGNKRIARRGKTVLTV